MGLFIAFVIIGIGLWMFIHAVNKLLWPPQPSRSGYHNSYRTSHVPTGWTSEIYDDFVIIPPASVQGRARRPRLRYRVFNYRGFTLCYPLQGYSHAGQANWHLMSDVSESLTKGCRFATPTFARMTIDRELLRGEKKCAGAIQAAENVKA